MTPRLITQSGLGSFWDAADVEVVREDGREITLTRHGTYQELFDAQPRRGQELDGWERFPVVRSTLKRKPGGMGTLVIIMGGGGDDNEDEDGVVSRRVKLSWREIQAPLTDGYYAVFGSSISVALVNAWRNEPDAALKAAYKFRNPVMYGSDGIYTVQYEVTELTGENLDLAKRIECGMESYSIWMPVVGITEQCAKEPRAVVVPMIVSAAALKAKYARKYIPLVAAGTGNAYSYMLQQHEVAENDKGWSVVKEYIGALAPQGALGAAWGAGKAFDPKYYPADSATPAARRPDGPQGVRHG